MRQPLHSLAVLSFLAACCSSANALVVSPTFDSSITSDANAATIEAGINQAIARFETSILTPITVNIDFQNMSTGVGASSTFINNISYSQYRSDLANNQIFLSPNDMTALASLPVQANNPVTGTPNMILTLPDLRAVGETTLGDNGGGFDGTIGLNLSIMNLSRTGPQNSSFFDLQAVASHEIDQVLGIGGSGSMIGSSFAGAGSMDLFRYSAPGVRSFTTSSSATAYFSIDGGATNLTNFNQAGGGSDFGDWLGVPGSPQVQDAFITPGVAINLGTNELTGLDVVGYTLVPEPGSGTLLLAGLIAIGILRYRRQMPNQTSLKFPV